MWKIAIQLALDLNYAFAKTGKMAVWSNSIISFAPTVMHSELEHCQLDPVELADLLQAIPEAIRYLIFRSTHVLDRWPWQNVTDAVLICLGEQKCNQPPNNLAHKLSEVIVFMIWYSVTGVTNETMVSENESHIQPLQVTSGQPSC